MKLIPTSLLLSVLVGSLATSLLALDNQAVIKMKKAGLADDTIVLAIRKEKAEFDTSADGLIELKQAGIADTVIQAILQPESAAPNTAVAARDEAFYGNLPAIAPPMVKPIAGQNYFTRFTLHYEGGEYDNTNYSRGELLPINTAVTVVAIGKKKLVLKRLDNGQELKVANKEKYTLKTADEFAGLMLSSEKTTLDRLPPKVAEAVSSGEMRKGMTKELVLMTRGYPPVHETPSLEQDRWVFWSSRFVKLTIVFADGRLSEGRGLY